MEIESIINAMNHKLSEGDIVISSTDVYFNYVVVSVTPGALTTRKIKWYEDTDTTVLYTMICNAFSSMLLVFAVWY